MRGRIAMNGVLCVLALGLALAAGIQRPAAADAEIAFEANPAAVDARKFSMTEPIRVLIRLKAGAKELRGITLAAYSNENIAAAVEGGDAAAAVATLPANSEHVWALVLKPSKAGAFPPAALKVYVSAAYTEVTEPPVARVSFATVAINAPADIAPPTMASVEIKGALDALSFERPAKAFVVVSNKYSSALTITDLRIHPPPFVTFVAVDKPPHPELGYGETRVIEYDVKAPEQVVPGKYPVVVTAQLRGADQVTGSVTAAPEINVGVLGESDLLAKLGAPSLLFLPGVLFLLTWLLLWSVGKTDAERQAFPLQPTNATFWLVGVVISLVTAVVYPTAVLRILHEKRDYLVAYGLRDYIYVFGLAIAASFATFCAWRILLLLYGLLHRVWLYLHMPKIGDRPVDILNKLAKHGSGTLFTQAYVAGGNTAELLLVLEPWATTTVWLATPARLTLTAAGNYQAVRLEDDITSGRIPNAAELHRIIKQGLDETWWTVEWTTVGPYTGVVTGPDSAWHVEPQRARLIR